MRKSLISALAAAGLIGVTPVWAQQQERVQGSEIDLTLRPAVVRQVQQALNKAGFDVGGVDGNLDKRVRDALASYQRSHGLEPTGLLSQRTLAALGITPQGGGQAGCDDQASSGQAGVGQIDSGQVGGGQARSSYNPVTGPTVARPTVVRPTVVRPTVARPMTRRMMTFGPSDELTGRANSSDLPQATCKSSRDFR